MRFLVLGCGMQGRAVIYDLLQSPEVEAVVAADKDLSTIKGDPLFQDKRLTTTPCDASDSTALTTLIGGGFDVVIDMLPVPFARPAAEAAIETGVHMVNANYGKSISDLHDRAEAAGVTLLPECGLDPGIDLILCGELVRQFDEVHELNSYGGGLPELSAADNFLKYKITWTYEGVLKSYADDARLLKEGEVAHIPHQNLFDEGNVHHVNIPDLGRMEATPNRDALHFVEQMSIDGSCRTAGRYTLRWPGHAAAMRPFSKSGFLSDKPLSEDLPSPREILRRVLEPQLQLRRDERDVVIIRVEAVGMKDGKRQRSIWNVIDYRDLESGFTAMNRTVSFTASIVAEMVASGEISSRGVLSPLRDVPYKHFIHQLEDRGITVRMRDESS